MRKFKRNFKKYICLSLCMALIITTVFVGTAATADNINYYRSAKVWKGGDNGDTISVSDYQLLDKNGNASSSCPLLTDIIESISNGMAAGEVRAKKTVFFESPEDAKKGYLKTNIDLVGNPSAQTTDPMDILFVVDTSGSMNMFSTEASYKSSVSPCLNEEHYYMIPDGEIGTYDNSTFTNTSGKDLYFRMKDLCPDGVTVYMDIEFTALNRYLQTAYGLTKEPIAISGSNSEQTKRFWGAFNSEFSHHYIPTAETGDGILEDQMICFKDSNGKIQATYSNMRPSKLYDTWKSSGHTGYGSPDFNNADGCFDRMMVTRQLLKSFSQDVLATNKEVGAENNNRVAMLDFGGFDGLGIGNLGQYGYAYVGMGGNKGYFPISNFVDFTDEKNSTDLEKAFTNTKGAYATDYQSALKSAEQVLIPKAEVDQTWANYKDYSETLSNSSIFDKGYIWSGSFPEQVNGGKNYNQEKRIYKWDENKYTGNENLVRVKGTRETAKKYVVFISDGAPGAIRPWYDKSYNATDEQKAAVREALRTNDTGIPDDTVIDAVKKSADVVYSVGYQIAAGKTDNLQKIASDSSSTYKNAQTTEEFTNFLNQIKETVLKYSCKSVTDTLGANYSFVCDADHQISIESGDGTKITYDSLDAAVRGGKFALSEDKKTLTWNGGDVGTDGVRISFYSKLDDEYLFPKSPGDGTNNYPTNSGQSLTYTTGEGDEARDTTGTVYYDDYRLQVKSGAAKVVLSNNPAGDVKSGSIIIYTLTVEKSGETGLVENVKVKATAPDNTTGEGIAETDIEVGNNRTYTVNVSEDTVEETVISNVAHFTVVDNSISNSSELDIDSINTNKVTNKVGNKTTITITAPTVEKGTHDLTQVFIYTVTDSDGKEVAKVMLKQGESATIGDLKPGTYIVTEVSDWAWRYSGMDGEKEQTVTTTTKDTEKSVTFTKNGSKKTGWLSGHSSKWSNKYDTNGGVKTNG